MKTRLIYIAIITAIVAFISACESDIKSNTLTVVSWGGKYQESLFNNWLLPSAKVEKLEVRGQSYGGEYKNITRMVETNTVTWDLIQVETFYAALAQERGLLAAFDPPINESLMVRLDDRTRKLLPYAYPTIGWSYVMSWNERILNERKLTDEMPKNWKDFWDLTKYPGKRALRDSPQGNIEIALLAAGYTHDQIYKRLYSKNDLSMLNEAFNSLDKIKMEIIWWSTGDQLQRELESGRSTLVAAWNGRVWNAINSPILEPKKSHGYSLSYVDAIMDYDWWVIPKGSRNIKQASDLVNALYRNKEGSLLFAKQMGYGSPISNWEADLDDEELIKYMPTTQSNIIKQFKIDPYFWAKNHEAIANKWEKWKAR